MNFNNATNIIQDIYLSIIHHGTVIIYHYPSPIIFGGLEVMANRVFDFMWHVSKNGYAIDDLVGTPDCKSGTAKRMLWDCSNPHICPDENYNPYTPLLDYPTLFIKFSRLDGSEESILQFANKHGRLGGPVISKEKGHLAKGGNMSERLESIEGWRYEIKCVKHMLRLWHDFDDKNIERIQSSLKDVRGIKSNYYWGVSLVEQELRIQKSEPQMLASVADSKFERDLYSSAQFEIWEITNHYLLHLTAPEIYWEPNLGRFILQIVPNCLLGAIWLQVALAITKDMHYRQCEACGEWFEVRPDTARSDKRFCGNACRNRVYRKRKKEATTQHNQDTDLK